MIPTSFLHGAALVCAAGLLAATASAAPLTVTWGAQGEGGALASSSGVELPPGCLVRLGYFNISLTDVQEIAWDPAALEGHFTELARATTGEFDGTAFGVTGTFAQTLPADSVHLTSQLSTRTVCMWALNAASLAEASELGIFTSSSWQAQSGGVGGLTWDLSQIEADGLIVGSFSPTASPTLGGQMIQLAGITDMRDASDEDRDGVAALLEEALGMDPNQADAWLMPEAVTLGQGAQPLVGYRFRRPAGATVVSSVVHEAAGFRYTVEVSDDLQHWRVDSSACQVHQVAAAGNGYEIVTLRPPLSATNRPDFYRLKVERMP
jgi:hypothetical protein